MNILNIPNWPFDVQYHDDWKGIIQNVAEILSEIGPWLLAEKTSPPHDKIFMQLQESLYDKRVCIVGIDPYPTNATGVPFESPNFSKKTIRVIASHLAKMYNVPSYTNYNFNRVEGVIPWNYYLSCREGETKSHSIYWERLSNLFINHLALFVSVFCFLGKTDFSNYKSILNSPKTVVVGYHPAARGGQFEKSEIFDIINILLTLNNKQKINWNQGFC